MTEDLDKDFIAAVRRGERGAWGSVYRDLSSAVFGYLYSQTNDADLSEDLTAKTFLEALSSAKRFRGERKGLRGWLVTIARNNLIDERRGQKRRPGEIPLIDDQMMDDQGPETQRSAEDLAIGSVEADRIRALISELSPDQREVLIMRVTSGMSAAEIAQAMDRSVGAVKVLVHRALKVLATKLESESGWKRA